MFALCKKHPEYTYTALVRSEEKGKLVTDAFPNVRTVQGDNDSSDLLKKESADADIVIRKAEANLTYTRLSSMTSARMQTQQTRPITRERQRPLPRVSSRATAKTTPDTGCTLVEPAS